MRGTLTAQQIKLLEAPLDPKRVKKSQGQSHLEGWDVRAHLTRIFGFGGWDETLLSVECIYEHLGNELKTDKKQWYVTYRCTMRLTIWGTDTEGNRAVAGIYEEGAIGGAENQPSHADAHDLAMKESMTQALKRCAINLGSQYGLSLYNDGSTASVAEVIGAPPEGAVPMADAAKKLKATIDKAYPRANDEWRKSVANDIWKEADAAKKVVAVNGTKYLPADECKILDDVTTDHIKGLKAPAEEAA